MEERWKKYKCNGVDEDSNVIQYFSNARTKEFHRTSRQAGNPFFIVYFYAMRPH